MIETQHLAKELTLDAYWEAVSNKMPKFLTSASANSAANGIVSTIVSVTTKGPVFVCAGFIYLEK